MSELDIAILALLAVGAIRGWRRGLVASVLILAGFFVGLVAAYMLNARFGVAIAPHICTSVSTARIISFFLIWVAVPIGTGIVGKVLTDLLDFLQLGCLNRLGGSIVGIVKYFVGLTCIVAFCNFACIGREAMSRSVACAFMDGFSQSFIVSVPKGFEHGRE